MVIDFLSRKIVKEIEFVTEFAADKAFMSVTPDEKIHEYWTYIFSLAGKMDYLADEEQDALFDELSEAYAICCMVLAMTRRELNGSA